jgi:BirA family biotin operon repressor/biotin-[acetyl-CoA-carboxylase] ligase
VTAPPLASALPATLAAALERAQTAGLSLGSPLDYRAETGSTNDDAKAAARAGAPHGALFVAGHQTAGRGRGSHRWLSPPGENLLASLVLRPSVPPIRMGELSLVAGLSLAAACESLLPPRPSTQGLEVARVRLKWPNDVWLDGLKVAGILVEGLARAGASPVAVVGFGLNVASRVLPPELAGRATSLALAGAVELDLGSVLVRALEQLAVRLDLWQRRGLSALGAELEARDALVGKVIRVGELEGVARGLDPEGRLLVQVGDAVVPVVAGEVLPS